MLKLYFKLKLFILFIFLIDIHYSLAQVFEGDLVLRNQQEVNTFNYTEVTGSLTIGQSITVGNIKDVSPLASLIRVGGNFRIAATQITKLDDLSNLNTIGGSIEIDDNPNLKSLAGPNWVSTINGNLSIRANDSLQHLDGLSNIRQILGNLTIRENLVLQDFRGLENLEYIDKTLNAIANSSLQNFLGLEKLTHIDGGLMVESNLLLQNFKGLSNLRLIRGDLDIRRNPNLQNMEGLEKLTDIRGKFNLERNEQLKNVLGLSSLQFVKGLFTVRRNEQLFTLEGLENLREVRNSVVIEAAFLRSVKGLSGLEIIALDFSVCCSPYFQDLSHLNSLREIGGRFNLNDNGRLTDAQTLFEPNTEIDTSVHLEVKKEFVVLRNSSYNLYLPPNLQKVGGQLRISKNFKVQNLYGLSNKEVSNNIYKITENPELLHIQGFANMKEIKGIEIRGNAKLLSIPSMSNLQRVDQDIIIQANAQLQTLPIISNLQEVGGNITINSNAALQNTPQMPSLKRVGGTLNIELNGQLREIIGFTNLQEVGESLDIRNNPELLRLDGLAGLRTTNTITLHENERLEDISGLSGVQSLNQLSVVSNPSLSDCCVLLPLADLVPSSTNLMISDNKAGCESLSIIMEVCEEAPTRVEITSLDEGQVFVKGERITISAQVSNLKGNEVQFFKANFLLKTFRGEDGDYTFIFDSQFINNTLPRMPMFSVKVVDSTGRVVAEDTVQVVVNPEQSIEITSLSEGQIFVKGERITISAQVSNLKGNEVQFFKANFLLRTFRGEDGIYTFIFDSQFVNNPPRMPVFSVKIVDSTGLVLAEDAVQVMVNPAMNIGILSQEALHIYPNPSSDQVSILTELGEGSLQILDDQGKMIHSQAVSANKEEVFDVSSLRSGLYTIVYISQDQVLRSTFIKP